MPETMLNIGGCALVVAEDTVGPLALRESIIECRYGIAIPPGEDWMPIPGGAVRVAPGVTGRLALASAVHGLVYADSFNGVTLDPFWAGDLSRFSQTGLDSAGNAVRGGVLHQTTLESPFNSGLGLHLGYVGLASVVFDARGKSIAIESIPLSPWPDADNSEVTFMLQDGDGNELFVDRSNPGDMTYFGHNDDQSAPFDATAHRWRKISISRDGGSATFSASPDGEVWTTLGTEAVDPAVFTDLEHSNVVLQGNFATIGVEIQWDNFSIRPVDGPGST